MSVHHVNSGLIRDTDMIWLDPYKLSMLLVFRVDSEIPLPLTSLQQEPQIRELGSKWTWDRIQRSIGRQVWDEIEDEETNWDGPRGQQQIKDSHDA